MSSSNNLQTLSCQNIINLIDHLSPLGWIEKSRSRIIFKIKEFSADNDNFNMSLFKMCISYCMVDSVDVAFTQ